MIEYKNIPNCPVETSLIFLGHKWKALIIRDLLTGGKRFSELKKSLNGITQKVLTYCLKELEADGLVLRKDFKTCPPHVEYSLTDVGYSLLPVLEAMAGWGTDYKKYLKLKEKRANAGKLNNNTKN